jgi:hypothetical protein
MAPRQQLAAMAFGQERPDRVVVLVRVRVVAVVPVHPVAEADRLLGLDGGELVDACLAQLDESVDPELLDLALVVEAELALDLDLDPQALAVEAVLVALPLAQHGVVALEEVLVGASPGVMHAHRVVRGDGPVDEAVAALRRLVARQVARQGVALTPTLDDVALERGDLQLARHRPEQLAHRSIQHETRPGNSGTGSLPRYHPRLTDVPRGGMRSTRGLRYRVAGPGGVTHGSHRLALPAREG